MTNNFADMLNPQMLNVYNSLTEQAKASQDPQAFMNQRVGYDPIYMQGIKILNTQGFGALTQFINEQKKNFPAVFK